MRACVRSSVCLSAHVWTPPALGFWSNDHNENTREINELTDTTVHTHMYN